MHMCMLLVVSTPPDTFRLFLLWKRVSHEKIWPQSEFINSFFIIIIQFSNFLFAAIRFISKKFERKAVATMRWISWRLWFHNETEIFSELGNFFSEKPIFFKESAKHAGAARRPQAATHACLLTHYYTVVYTFPNQKRLKRTADFTPENRKQSFGTPKIHMKNILPSSPQEIIS